MTEVVSYTKKIILGVTNNVKENLYKKETKIIKKKLQFTMYIHDAGK